MIPGEQVQSRECESQSETESQASGRTATTLSITAAKKWRFGDQSVIGCVKARGSVRTAGKEPEDRCVFIR